MCKEPGIIVIGAGGHSRSIIDVLECAGFAIAGIVHNKPQENHPAMPAYPFLGTDADLPQLHQRFARAVIGIGQIKSAEPRKKMFNLLNAYGFDLPTIIAPDAYVSRTARLGKGVMVMRQALINANAQVNDNCIVNTKALIEHDCQIDKNCHIAIGALICGGVKIGEGSFIGAGAICRENASIGKNCVIGCGCVIKKNVPDNSMIRGTANA